MGFLKSQSNEIRIYKIFSISLTIDVVNEYVVPWSPLDLNCVVP